MRCIAICLFGFLVVTLACESQKGPVSQTADGNDKATSGPRLLDASSSVDGTAPNATSPRQLTVDSSPEDVCRAFMSALQSGDHITAQNLLTRQALLETKRAELELEAPGSATSVYEVLPARFATSKKEVAQVDCRLTLGVADENPMLTWVLKLQSNGWKISGMTIQTDDNSVDLLSFENPMDVARIKESVSGTGDETRHATRPESADNVRMK